MAYIAVKRLRFGDGHIEPGEPVPEWPGRNYRFLLANGDISVASTDGSTPGDAPKDVAELRKRLGDAIEAREDLADQLAEAVARAEAAEARVAEIEAADGHGDEAGGGQDAVVSGTDPENGPETAEQLAQRPRKELDEIAVEAGVDSPDRLANRNAVAEAIVARRAARAADGHGDE